MALDTIVLRSVEEAQQEMLEHFRALPAEVIPLQAALGRTLAEDMRADMDVPPFANSAMDGYAVRVADLRSGSDFVLQVIGEVPAGGVAGQPVEPGTAMRIMTGAPLPAGADTVVPFEDTDEGQTGSLLGVGKVRIRTVPSAGANVRAAGEDVRANTVVVPHRTPITPAAVGVLASIGAATVPVYRRPRVAILATGDELVDVGERPGPGQIRNANGYANAAQVLVAGGEVLQLPIARDTEAELRARLQQGLDWGADLFLTSGGVSVGDYDVVKKVLKSMGEMQFWRVRMKPGKPIAFGHIGAVPLLGLPGNPVSAMVCFELFGRPALLKMQGRRSLFRPFMPAIFEGRLEDRADRRQYVRVRVKEQDGEFVARLTGEQGSGVLSSMLSADGLMVVPEGMTDVEPGTRLQVMMLYWPEVDPEPATGIDELAGADCC
jgi:molybdopterin molybdotransferase